MPVRKTPLAVGEYYHIFSRGVDRRIIFDTTEDYLRFEQTLCYYLFDDQRGRFSLRGEINPLGKRDLTAVEFVTLVGYCLMPNHFHLLLKQEVAQGISTYLHRLLNSYTHYFNLKNQRQGSLFEGRFKSVHVRSNEQLLHLSRYLHLNPCLAGMVQDVEEYPYSSYRHYQSQDNEFVKSAIVTKQFSGPNEYEKFVKDHKSFARQTNKIRQIALEPLENR
ncbi:transposase [Patescibacteria group bacterium]|nr:transposase [Patescibacteria group bacterium]